jgi:hypothetical protein
MIPGGEFYVATSGENYLAIDALQMTYFIDSTLLAFLSISEG